MPISESLRALMTGAIDYAGMFPPSSLERAEAVRHYQKYRAGSYAWMLGRFVVPSVRASEVPKGYPLSVVAADKRSERAGDVEYIEIPVTADPAGIAGRAKIRTGGATPDAFPSAEKLAGFLVRAAETPIAFKATAGLHHPLPAGPMHGFVNLLLAACLAWHGGSEADVVATLHEHDFHFTGEDASWGDWSVTTSQIRAARAEFAIGFGSCSFEEPIEGLVRLGWL